MESSKKLEDYSDLEILKFNLQESKYPYFSDEDLTMLLLQYGSVEKASYQGCVIKSVDDSVSLGPIDTVSNQEYWLRMAKRFKSKGKTDRLGRVKNKTMTRADEFYVK